MAIRPALDASTRSAKMRGKHFALACDNNQYIVIVMWLNRLSRVQSLRLQIRVFARLLCS